MPAKGKGIGFYVMIFLGIALAIVLVLAAIMIFGRVQLFGLAYTSVNRENTYDKVRIDGSNTEITMGLESSTENIIMGGYALERIVVNTQIHNVVIEPVETENVSGYSINLAVVVKTNVAGFQKVKQETDIDLEQFVKVDIVYKESKIIVDITSRSTIFAFRNNCEVIVKIPKNLLDKAKVRNLLLEVKTENGDIRLGSTGYNGGGFMDLQAVLQVKNFDIETQRGAIIITRTFYANSTDGASRIYSGNGNITSNGRFNIRNLNLEAVRGDVKFLNMTVNSTTTNMHPIIIADKFSINGDRSYFTIGTIGPNMGVVQVGTLEFMGYSGSLDVAKVEGTVFIVGQHVDNGDNMDGTRFTIMSFAEVSGNFSAGTLGKAVLSGDLKIGKLNTTLGTSSIINIESAKYIEIDEVRGNRLAVTTRSTPLTIAKCFTSVDVTTRGSDITIHMADNTDDAILTINVQNGGGGHLDITNLYGIVNVQEIPTEQQNLDGQPAQTAKMSVSLEFSRYGSGKQSTIKTNGAIDIKGSERASFILSITRTAQQFTMDGMNRDLTGSGEFYTENFHTPNIHGNPQITIITTNRVTYTSFLLNTI